MSRYFFLFVIFVGLSTHVLCDSGITITMENGTTVDLQAYLADLQVAAASIQYTANLNARMLGELKERLDRDEVDCRCDDRKSETRPLRYVLHDSEHLTWNEARLACMEQGGRREGRLAIIKSSFYPKEIIGILRGAKNLTTDGDGRGLAFVGIHKFFGEWVTVQGEQVSRHLMWTAPFAFNNKCGAYTSNNDLTMRDCNEPHAYICEY